MEKAPLSSPEGDTIGVGNGANLLSLVVGNRDSKLFLKLHDELNGIQRISTQIVREACFGLHFSLINTKFINDNCLYFAFNF